MDDEEEDEEEEKEVEVEKPKKKRAKATTGKEESEGAAIAAGDKPTAPAQLQSPMPAKPSQKKIRSVLEKTHSPKPAPKQSPPKSPAPKQSPAAVPKTSPPPGMSSCHCVVCFKYIVTVRV